MLRAPKQASAPVARGGSTARGAARGAPSAAPAGCEAALQLLRPALGHAAAAAAPAAAAAVARRPPLLLLLIHPRHQLHDASHRPLQRADPLHLGRVFSTMWREARGCSPTAGRAVRPGACRELLPTPLCPDLPHLSNPTALTWPPSQPATPLARPPAGKLPATALPRCCTAPAHAGAQPAPPSAPGPSRCHRGRRCGRPLLRP